MRKKGILWELAAIGGVIARLNLVNQEERADETRLHQAMSHFTLIRCRAEFRIHLLYNSVAGTDHGKTSKS